MQQDERKMLAEAAIPLEVLCAQINSKPYKEMTLDFQKQLCESLAKIRILLFGVPNSDGNIDHIIGGY